MNWLFLQIYLYYTYYETPENNCHYFAECPVCTEFVNNNNYRLKIRPKTGFQYAVYLEDGTRPDYDNTMPFEIVV